MILCCTHNVLVILEGGHSSFILETTMWCLTEPSVIMDRQCLLMLHICLLALTTWCVACGRLWLSVLLVCALNIVWFSSAYP